MIGVTYCPNVLHSNFEGKDPLLAERPKLGYLDTDDFARDAIRRFLASRSKMLANMILKPWLEE